MWSIGRQQDTGSCVGSLLCLVKLTLSNTFILCSCEAVRGDTELVMYIHCCVVEIIVVTMSVDMKLF